ncbi:MAG: B12-binding domain-containing radical SAM protein [Thermoanaerobaculales bacterium]|nr:B12-binding domain-containing radical SAM protein [Thermoanaerobaculales bacterium]
MKILLIKPKARLGSILGLQAFQLLEPLELGYLAAAVSPKHDVRILDLRLARFGNRALKRAVQTFGPDLVGLTGYSHEGSIVKELARRIRRLLPLGKIVVGGHHATVAPEDLDIEEIDAIVRGEGCGPFRSLVERLEAGDSFEGIGDVMIPGGSKAMEKPDEWPIFPDPATLPVPRRDLWDCRRYSTVWLAEDLPAGHPLFPQVSTVRTSWGCKMKCSFCIVPFLCEGRHWPRPVQSVVDEIAAVSSDHIYFSDDENFIDVDFAWRLAEGLEKAGVQKRYFAWTRSTTVNGSPELFRKWRSIGLDAAFLGFEFSTDAALKKVVKGGTVAGNERALDVLRSMGIAVHAAFMVMPDFDDGDFQSLKDYVERLPPCECSFTVCTPSPGTPDYSDIERKIWVDNPHDLHDCMHPLTPTAVPLRRFAQAFADLTKAGTANIPMRVNKHRAPHLDLVRIILAEGRYNRGFRRMYRDYPRELWG